ncbi:HD-GYP domain-containing protein [Alicyclobacillus mengziensis]|uniref:HD-GYP domain-containing protein n=1 Tax=Alicyclobacillus mengziensis TaxID=2931921 RepID=A0A9X7VZH3_9BACL|nr:HD-GYP domain-containing protein [Alicyclobacillus mengziensis]QSO47953.1 HD-GYP domain-containing protein [Alicyclobacillus mengziensis]
MRWVSLRTIAPDRVLAQNILDERGRILLARGMKLSAAMIDRLRKLGIGSVCIEDAMTDDLKGKEFINPHTRQALLEATYQTLNEMISGTYSRVVRPPRLRQRLQPLILEVIDQLRRLGGAGEHFGTVYLSDGELYHHSVNVALFALGVAVGMGMTESQMIDLGIGALLHDIGKLKIPESILKKPGRLTDEEFEHMKLHTSYGYQVLRETGDINATAALVALEHHERVDGTGYPRGLVGSEIHLFGRVTGLVDVYEALTANRVYRPANLPHDALEFLLGGGGTQFDPTVVHAFVKTISVYPIGMTLVLSTGYKAVVINSPHFQTQRPVVRIIEDVAGNVVNDSWEIDLAKDLTTQIVGCES